MQLIHRRAHFRNFSPLSLSPALWLDASDASTLYDAATGGNLVAADGTIARWEDKSSNGRHATQATSGSRPIRKTAQQNGLDAVLSNSKKLNIANTTVGSVFLVCKSDTGSGYQCPLQIVNGAGAWMLLYNGAGYYASSAFCNNYWCDGISGYPSTQPPTSYHVFSGTRTTPATASSIGVGDYDGYFNLNGKVLEIIFFATALGTADRQSVERYLGAKWGISVA